MNRYFIFLFIFTGLSYAQESSNFFLGPYKQVVEARIQVWNLGIDEPKALLVLTPSFGSNPSGLALKEIEDWKKYAQTYKFALVFIDFKWLNLNSKNLDPMDGGMEILNQIIAKISGQNLPIFMCGRSDAGNRFVLDCIDRNTNLIKGWLCYANREWLQNPKKMRRENIPGIIATTTDSIWYNQSKSYFNLARNAGKNWTWIGYEPIDSPKIRGFAFDYFEALLTESTGYWRDISTREEVTPDLFQESSMDWSWFPSKELGELWSKIQREQTHLPTVVETEVDLSKDGLNNLKLYLRLPSGQKDAAQVNGVIAYCTWVQDRNALIQQLSFDTNQPTEKLGWPAIQMLRFASKHNLAVVTWSTPGKWQLTGNTDDLQKEQIKADSKEFDVFSRAWVRGINFFHSNYQLPDNNYLLYGMSRGAQWAHRLALRKPEYFLAINIHVAGTYENPTKAAQRCLWLITSGEDDPGYENSISFYKKCLESNYSVIFKAGKDLGHETRSDIEILRDVFFEYALSVKDVFNERSQNEQKSRSFFKEKTEFIGNFSEHTIFSIGNTECVPEKYKVYFPTEELANAWKILPPDIEK